MGGGGQLHRLNRTSGDQGRAHVVLLKLLLQLGRIGLEIPFRRCCPRLPGRLVCVGGHGRAAVLADAGLEVRCPRRRAGGLHGEREVDDGGGSGAFRRRLPVRGSGDAALPEVSVLGLASCVSVKVVEEISGIDGGCKWAGGMAITADISHTDTRTRSERSSGAG